MFSYGQSYAARWRGAAEVQQVQEVQGAGGGRRALGGASALWWVAEPGKKRPQARPAEQAEAAALRALGRDVDYAAKVARVRRHQARLRRQLSARAWQAYLRLEEVEIERWSYALERVARWAASSRRRAQRR
jgi:hypothetical protein